MVSPVLLSWDGPQRVGEGATARPSQKRVLLPCVHSTLSPASIPQTTLDSVHVRGSVGTGSSCRVSTTNARPRQSLERAPRTSSQTTRCHAPALGKKLFESHVRSLALARSQSHMRGHVLPCCLPIWTLSALPTDFSAHAQSPSSQGLITSKRLPEVKNPRQESRRARGQ